jgi:hypothetical protein
MIHGCCKLCRSYVKEGDRQGFCHAHPPQAMLLPVQGQLGAQGIAIQGVWPPVKADSRCSEFSAELSIQVAERVIDAGSCG